MKPKERAFLAALIELLDDFEADFEIPLKNKGKVRIHFDSFSRNIDLPDLSTETLKAIIE